MEKMEIEMNNFKLMIKNKNKTKYVPNIINNNNVNNQIVNGIVLVARGEEHNKINKIKTKELIKAIGQGHRTFWN